jgi:hypothetical protein
MAGNTDNLGAEINVEDNAKDPLARVKKGIRRADLKRIGQLIRDERPVPVGTILDNGREQMEVTGHGYYDMDGNRSDELRAGMGLVYEGDLIRWDPVVKQAVYVRTLRGEKCEQRMRAAQIHKVRKLSKGVAG